MDETKQHLGCCALQVGSGNGDRCAFFLQCGTPNLSISYFDLYPNPETEPQQNDISCRPMHGLFVSVWCVSMYSLV